MHLMQLVCHSHTFSRLKTKRHCSRFWCFIRGVLHTNDTVCPCHFFLEINKSLYEIGLRYNLHCFFIQVAVVRAVDLVKLRRQKSIACRNVGFAMFFRAIFGSALFNNPASAFFMACFFKAFLDPYPFHLCFFFL